MKIYDILTKWIIKTYSMWEKCVQILYSSINNSKICQRTPRPLHGSDSDGVSPLHPYYSRDYRSSSHLSKVHKTYRSMGQIWTTYLLCTRSTLETTALRVTFVSQTPWQLRTQLIFYENLWYFDQINHQDAFYVGKMCTEHVQLHTNSKIYLTRSKPVD